MPSIRAAVSTFTVRGVVSDVGMSRTYPIDSTVVKRDTETDRVMSTATVLARDRGVSGAIGTRPSDQPWWETSLRPGELLLEWPGPMPHDPFFEEHPRPPRWVDVIASLDGSTKVRVRLRLDAGEVKRIGFEVYDPTGELTTRLLRQAPGGLVETIDALLEEWLVGRLVGSVWRRQVKRPGRAGRPDVFYAEWAARYVAAVVADPKSPIKRLVSEEERSGRYVTEAQIRAYLTKARSRGLLTRTSAGAAGGHLTAKGSRALQRHGINEGSEG
jgi:hypothetical protein